MFFFFFSSRRRHTRSLCDWSSDVCSSDLNAGCQARIRGCPRRRRGRGRDRANKEESVRIGYKLFAEVFSPQELVAQAVRAEEAGFDFVEISNHYHPWLFSHDHSGFAWSILGTIAARTERI